MHRLKLRPAQGRTTRQLQQPSRICGWLSVVIGGLALLDWIFEFLVGRGRQQEFFDAGFAVVLIVTFGAIMMAALIWWNAELISRIDRARQVTRDMLKQKEEDARTLSEQLKLVVEHVPSAVALLDTQMHYLWVSNRWKADHRLEGKDFVGRSHYEIFPETSERWKEVYRRCLAGAIEQADDDHFERADGSIDYVRWEVRPWYDAHGQIGGIIIFSEDITRRKIAEAALRKVNEELEERVRIRTQEIELQAAILRNMAEGVCMVRTSDRTIAYANPKFEAMFGYDRGELEGKHVAILNYGNGNPKAAEERAEEIIAATLRECVFNYEVHNVRKDGTPFWCRATTSQFQHPKFGLVLVAVQEDVTERKQAKLALEVAEERYRTLFTSALDGILVANADGEILLANPQLEKTFGYQAHELIGEPVEILIPERFREGYRVKRAAFMRDRTAHMMGVSGEFLGRKRDGTEFPVDISLSPVDLHGELRVTAIVRNITERKEFERSLAIKAKELERSNTELQQFAYVTSHDLREPLRVVTNYAQMLERRYKGRLDESADKYIGYIVDGVSRMQLLIGDLLSYSRVGQGELTLDYVSLGEVVEQVLGDLQVKMRETKAIVTSTALPTIVANRYQIGQVLQNLLDNAMKFHRPDCPPHIKIAAHAHPDEWEISVADEGIGIEPQFLNRIFVIFQRLHGRAEYPGTGIGLAICKKIIERHGGRIWAESEVGKGTTFHFTIPSSVARQVEGTPTETIRTWMEPERNR